MRADFRTVTRSIPGSSSADAPLIGPEFHLAGKRAGIRGQENIRLNPVCRCHIGRRAQGFQGAAAIDRLWGGSFEVKEVGRASKSSKSDAETPEGRSYLYPIANLNSVPMLIPLRRKDSISGVDRGL